MLNLPLVTLLFTLFAASSFAQSDASSYRILGRGIQQEKTREIILMACVGNMETLVSPNCDRLRLLLVRPGFKPAWLSNVFMISDIPNMQQRLDTIYSHQFGSKVFTYFKNTYAFSDQNGWNWSNEPLQISEKKYEQVISAVLYYAVYNQESVLEQKKLESQPVVPTPVILSKEEKRSLFENCISISKKQNTNEKADEGQQACLVKYVDALDISECISHAKDRSSSESTNAALGVCFDSAPADTVLAQYHALGLSFEWDAQRNHWHYINEHFLGLLNQKLKLKSFSFNECVQLGNEMSGAYQERAWALCFNRFSDEMSLEQIIDLANHGKETNLRIGRSRKDIDLPSEINPGTTKKEYWLADHKNLHDVLLQTYLQKSISRLSSNECFVLTAHLEDRVRRKASTETCTEYFLSHADLKKPEIPLRVLTSEPLSACIAAAKMKAADESYQDSLMEDCLKNFAAQASLDDCIQVAKSLHTSEATNESLKTCARKMPKEATIEQLRKLGQQFEDERRFKKGFTDEYPDYISGVSHLFYVDLPFRFMRSEFADAPILKECDFFTRELQNDERYRYGHYRYACFNQLVKQMNPQQCVAFAQVEKTFKDSESTEPLHDRFTQQCIDSMKSKISQNECLFIAKHIENRIQRQVAVETCLVLK